MSGSASSGCVQASNGSNQPTVVPPQPASAQPQSPERLVQLQQHLTLLRTVIDSTDDWIFVKDTELRYVLANRSYAAALNLSPEQLLGKTDLELGCSAAEVDGDPTEEICSFRPDDTAVLSGQPVHNPYDVITLADGTRLIFDTHKQPLYDETGRVSGIVAIAKNITDRHTAQVQLAESRNLLQLVLDTFPQRVFWKDKDSVYLGCNRAFAEDAGLSAPAESVGKTDFDLPWTTAEAEFYQSCDRRVIETRIPKISFEESHLWGNSQLAWLEITKVPLCDENDQVIGILGSYQDITERKQAETTLRESQQRLNLVIEQTPLAVIEWDTQGYVHQWNPAAETIFGYSRTEAIGKHFRLIVPAEISDEVDQIFSTILASPGGLRTVNDNVTKAGDRITCEWSTTPLVDAAGQVVGVASMASDITERIQAAAQLAAQAKRQTFRADIDAALIRNTLDLRAMLQWCTDAVVEHLGGAFARIWLLNPAENMLELQASSGLYTHIDGAHGRVPVGQFKIGLIAAERAPHLTNDVLNDPRVGDKDWAKREGMVAFAGYPLMLDSELLGVVATFSRQPFSQEALHLLEDAAGEIALGVKRYQVEMAHRQSEAALRQRTEELEQAMNTLQQAQLQMVQSEKMSALGNLVAGVAHEINNPVGFLRGNIRPAKDYVSDLFGLLDLYQTALPCPGADIEAELEAVDLGFLREDLPKLLDSMSLGVDRIQSISTSLRTFSRADQEHKTTFNLHEGLDSTLLILKHRLKASEHRPEIAVMRDYGKIPLVECFPGQLNQVFMNLLANAIDALEESNQGRSPAEIKATPNQILITTRLADDGKVQVAIRDNGTGMPESVKARIFDHLFTTKTVGKGTGLGLAIAHQIVTENHSGQIQVESVAGEGTTFILTLPVRA